MEGSERDDTQDWLLPANSAPPLLSELEQRIDQALIIAKSSERAAIAVGDAAIDAAQQARRAADLAERATAAAFSVTSSTSAAAAPPVADRATPEAVPVPVGDPTTRGAPPADPALRSFSERADRLAARLRALERRPRAGHPASVSAGRRRPGG